MTQNEKLVRSFLHMLETRTSTDELDNFYHPEVEQIEYPNSLTKNITVRNLQQLKEAAERGKKLLIKEEYEIKNFISFENTILLECTWKGTLAIPLGAIPVGGQMIAHFAQIFEIKDWKIFRQRNYDCFERFE